MNTKLLIPLVMAALLRVDKPTSTHSTIIITKNGAAAFRKLIQPIFFLIRFREDEIEQVNLAEFMAVIMAFFGIF